MIETERERPPARPNLRKAGGEATLFRYASILEERGIIGVSPVAAYQGETA